MTKQTQTINEFSTSSFNCIVSLKLQSIDNRFHPDFNILTSVNSIQMSTQVQSSLANLKASTAQLVGIIAGARHIPAGSVDVHLVLTKQVTTLLVC
jgi:hypothetical protein